MFDQGWKKTLKTYLPMIGGALGGPVAGLAIQAGLKAFGASDADIKQSGNPLDLLKNIVLGASPDDVVKARGADDKFKKDMAEIGVQLENIHQKDRASARDLAKTMGAFWQNTVGLLLITSSIGIMFYIIIIGLRPDTNDIALIMLGYLTGWSGSYIVFLFGSSKGSKEKDKQIAALTSSLSDK